MTRKETFFFGLIALSAVAFALAFVLGYPAVAFGALVVHLAATVYLAALPSHVWAALGFPALWFLVDLVLGGRFVLLGLAFGLPLMVVFYTVKKNFTLRVKIDFNASVQPALTRFFVLVSLVFSLSIAFNLSNERIKGFLEGSLPQTVEVQGEKLPLKTKLGDLIEKEMKPLIEQCHGAAECVAIARARIEEQVKSSFGTADAGKTFLDLLIEKTGEQTKMALPILAGVLVFVIFAPLSFLFSAVATLFFSLGFSFLRGLRVFAVERHPVEQEVLV